MEGIAQSLDPQYNKDACSVLRETFNYEFNEDGELRDVNTNNSFVFDVHHDREKNQGRYDKITKVITQHI